MKCSTLVCRFDWSAPGFGLERGSLARVPCFEVEIRSLQIEVIEKFKCVRERAMKRRLIGSMRDGEEKFCAVYSLP